MQASGARSSQPDTSELVVVANRLPVEPVRDADGAVTGWRRAPGGLVSALDPVLRSRPSIWVGAGDMAPAEAFGSTRLEAVAIPAEDVVDYYEGFCNSAIWPLYHDAVATPDFHRRHFEAYRRVNARFAERIAAIAAPGATVWVHDYQLQLLPGMLRERRPDLVIGFFLHIPFPPNELYAQLPWRTLILRGLLGADLVGFQTHDGAANFLTACRRQLGLRVEGHRVLVSGRSVTVGAFPIGIDAEGFAELASAPQVQERAAQLRARLGNPDTLLLGVDRLDYTKGIDIRLKAFAELLKSGRLDPAGTVLVQVAVPSRQNVRQYQRVRDEVELLVGRFNGDLSSVAATPIHYLHRDLDREELVALYLAADVMLVTPVRDGMNLVCKEYVATRDDDSGALILSEFTGAAAQLTDAWLVNPYDTSGVEDAIEAAVRATDEERSGRMRSMRKVVFESDVVTWAHDFLDTLPRGHAPRAGARAPAEDRAGIPLGRLATAPHLLVCCDYDGTLAPIVEVPSRAFPVPESIVALRALSLLPSTTVAVVSGRALRDLAALSRLPGEVHLVGSHGSEFDEDPGIDRQQQRLLEQCIAAVRELADAVPGSLVETKPSSVAVHVRRCTPEVGVELMQRVAMGPGQFPGVLVRYGKAVIELSVVHAVKADAVDLLRHRVGATSVLFVGDDVTDESVFTALGGPDVGVKVGPGQTAASWRVPAPADVADLLFDLVAQRERWLLGGHASAIEEYVLLSNRRSVALLSPLGSIDWFCAPDPDSPATFAALLGDESSGHFGVRPVGGGPPLAQAYVPGTLTARTRWPGLSVLDYMPLPEPGDSTSVRIVRRITGSEHAEISFVPRPQFGAGSVTIEPIEDGLLVVAGTDRMVLVAPHVTWCIDDASGRPTATAVVDPRAGDVVLELRYGTSEIAPAKESEPSVRARTEREWRAWLQALDLPGIRPEEEARSALTLRALAHPDGGILAAATSSLPERVGGVRNWDHRYSWLRDAAMAARELVAVGSRQEAEAFVGWLLRLVEAGTAPRDLHPVYTVLGHRVASEAVIDTLPGYAGSRPVRVGNAARGQFQLDAYGLVIALVDELSERRGHVTGPEWELVRALVETVAERWQQPDHGIWEVRSQPRHHTHSRMMCWLALDRALRIATRAGTEEPPGWLALREAIVDDVETRGWDSGRRAYVAAYDLPEADAAVLHGLLEGYPAPPGRVVDTVAFVERELRRAGGVYRYTHEDGLPRGEAAMHACSAWLAGVYVRMGAIEDAVQMLDAMLAASGAAGLLPEQVDPLTERGLGNHPRAYSHLGVLAVARRLAAARDG